MVKKAKKVTLIIQKEFLNKIDNLTTAEGIRAQDVIDVALRDYLKDKKIKPAPKKTPIKKTAIAAKKKKPI